MLVGTVHERLAKVADPSRREALKSRLPYAGTAALDSIVVIRAHAPDAKRFENHTVGDIGRILDKHHIDAFLDIAAGDQLKTTFYVDTMSHEIKPLRDIIDYPWAIPGVSDGGAHIKFLTLGVYPTDMLSWLVRDTNTLTLEEAHFRLSTLPAHAAQFKDRGTLREGLAADIVVYDLNSLKALPIEIAYDLPAGEWRRVQKAQGYRWIMVNGGVTFEDGKCTGATPGKLLRSGRAS